MSFLTKLSQFFSKNSSSQRLGIAFQQQGVSLCSIPMQKSDSTIDESTAAKVIFEHEKVNSANFTSAVQALHSKRELEGSACLVLNEAQSQVVQIDKPSLPDNEMNSALKWQIKDLVSVSPNNMVVDYYDAPMLAGGKEKINVVCAPLDELKKLVETTEQGAVKISEITTQEFAFANLLAPQDDANLLVCQQPNEEIVLIIVKQQKIFFQRRLRGFAQIGSKSAEELSFSIIDDIGLEIQRSTDYFERQLKQAPIKAIKVLLPIALEKVFVEKLAENSIVPVSLLELPRPYHQHRDFAAAIGASLDNVPYKTETEDLAGGNDDN
ncbi:hypothetical protein [Colwellia psychrerythraea]|uniref:MSHA biogenesis protein MshI n=1 Tax=Colwellia psychrerythraea TaxID=28229 RepID=A0A099KWR0_COLPS|nr:hypothetical protein [Colwellia psychrerythraea]KGJ94317.1 hypothetical protein ND2E_1506 [Colwellia psychrerythraea]